MNCEAIVGQYALNATAQKLSTLLGIPDNAKLFGSIGVKASHEHAITIASASILATLQNVSIFAFTVSSANATAGATYTSPNGTVFTVDGTIASGTTLIAHTAVGSAPDTPDTTLELTKVSGTGDSTITYSAVAANNLNNNPLVIAASVAWTSYPKLFDAGSILVSAATPNSTDTIIIDCVKG